MYAITISFIIMYNKKASFKLFLQFSCYFNTYVYDSNFKIVEHFLLS